MAGSGDHRPLKTTVPPPAGDLEVLERSVLRASGASGRGWDFCGPLRNELRRRRVQADLSGKARIEPLAIAMPPSPLQPRPAEPGCGLAAWRRARGYCAQFPDRAGRRGSASRRRTHCRSANRPRRCDGETSLRAPQAPALLIGHLVRPPHRTRERCPDGPVNPWDVVRALKDG